MPAIDSFLIEVMERRGSDLHFIAGDPPRIRLYGDLGPLRADKLEPSFVKDALYEIMPKPALDRFESKDGADFAYTLPERGRFRVNIMRQINGLGGVFRVIPSNALTMDEAPAGCASDGAREQWSHPRDREDRLGKIDNARLNDR